MSFWIDILLIVLLVGVSVILILQRRQLKQVERKQQRLESQIHSLEEERPALAQMARLKGDDETFQLIRNRYDLTAELLAARVSGDAERTDAMLEHVDQLVADPAEFMRQLRLIFARMQPLMMERFRESGLTDREVEICCLYALGLNGNPAIHPGRAPLPERQPHPQETGLGRTRQEHRRIHPLPATVKHPPRPSPGAVFFWIVADNS